MLDHGNAEIDMCSCMEVKLHAEVDISRPLLAIGETEDPNMTAVGGIVCYVWLACQFLSEVNHSFKGL